jgi:hypothetical protein
LKAYVEKTIGTLELDNNDIYCKKNIDITGQFWYFSVMENIAKNGIISQGGGIWV